jgi:hypothetical protein
MSSRTKDPSRRRSAPRLSAQQIVFVLLSILIVASFVLSMFAAY